MRKYGLLVISFTLLTGCAGLGVVSTSDTVTMTISTQPSGARIKELSSGRILGTSPVLIRYHLTPEAIKARQSGCISVKGITATWPGGTSASSSGVITLCGQNDSYIYSMEDPQNVDNHGTDETNKNKADTQRKLNQMVDTQRKLNQMVDAQRKQKLAIQLQQLKMQQIEQQQQQMMKFNQLMNNSFHKRGESFCFPNGFGGLNCSTF